jgi:hypothetical protein
VQIKLQQAHPEYNEVRLNVIVVSPSGVFPMRSQKDFAIPTLLPRNRLAAHTRFVVDAAITSAHKHYGAYCTALAMKEKVQGAHPRYDTVEQ